MWSLDRNSSGVVLVRRRPARAVTLSGALGLCLALVPLSIAPELGLTQILASLCFAASGAALVFLGWSRPERVAIERKAGGIVWGDEPLPPPAFALLGSESLEDPPAYQVYVAWSDGQRRLALERNEPHAVLGDALLLAARLELELRPGWGLEEHFPESGLAAAWHESAAQSSANTPPATGSFDLPAFPMQKRPALVTTSAGVFVLLETLFLARSPARLVVPSAFALVLPIIAAATALAIGGTLLGLRRRIELTRRGIESTPVLFGRPLGRSLMLGAAPSRFFAVSPDRGPVRHVLFATAEGPLALAADDEGARRLATRSYEPLGGELLREAAPIGATSARYSGPDRPARLRS